MRTALGFGWLVWRRARVAYLATLACSLLMAIIARTPFAVYALPFGSVYFSGAGLALLMALLFADGADVAATASGYPKYLLLAPIDSRGLAAWPMAFGALAVGTAWLAFAAVGLADRYGAVAVVLPGIGLIALLLGLQAAAWVPLPVPLARSLLSLLTIGALAAWGPLALMQGVAPAVIGAGYAAACAVAFAVANGGLAKARRGDSVEWKLPSSSAKPEVELPPCPPFLSPMEAQVWYESRRNGLVLPAMSAFASLVLILPVLLAGHRAPASLGPFTYAAALPVYLMPMLMIAVLSGFDGGCGCIRDTLNEDFSLAPLLSTRPLGDAALVEAKLRMAARAVLRSWAILAPGPILLLLSPVTVEGRPTRVGLYLLQHASANGVALALLAVATLAFFAWRGIAAALWLRMCHRPWLRNGVGVALPTAVLFCAPFAWMRTQDDPTLVPALMRWAIPSLAVLALAKVVFAFAAARQVRALGLIPDGTLVRWPLAWLVVGATLFLGYWRLLPAGLVSPAALALGIFLLLPLVRVQLAVLVVHDNRHR